METIVATDAGKLVGREKNGVLLFAGVPFAAPPVGDGRFRPPRPVEPWDGTREALRFSPWAAGSKSLGMPPLPATPRLNGMPIRLPARS